MTRLIAFSSTRRRRQRCRLEQVLPRRKRSQENLSIYIFLNCFKSWLTLAESIFLNQAAVLRKTVEKKIWTAKLATLCTRQSNVVESVMAILNVVVCMSVHYCTHYSRTPLIADTVVSLPPPKKIPPQSLCSDPCPFGDHLAGGDAVLRQGGRRVLLQPGVQPPALLLDPGGTQDFRHRRECRDHVTSTSDEEHHVFFPIRVKWTFLLLLSLSLLLLLLGHVLHLVVPPSLPPSQLNIFILLNVTRVLFTHLSGNEDSDINQIRKSLKSLLFLLPLLGITNILPHLWPNPLRGSWVSFAVWSVATHFLYSFQGVFVACVYFFFDKKVTSTAKCVS